MPELDTGGAVAETLDTLVVTEAPERVQALSLELSEFVVVPAAEATTRSKPP